MEKQYHKNLEAVMDLLEDRLNVVGTIKTCDAWEICKGHFLYGTVTNEFRYIMELMIEQGKAKKLKSGIWEILRPNKIYIR